MQTEKICNAPQSTSTRQLRALKASDLPALVSYSGGYTSKIASYNAVSDLARKDQIAISTDKTTFDGTTQAPQMLYSNGLEHFIGAVGKNVKKFCNTLELANTQEPGNIATGIETENGCGFTVDFNTPGMAVLSITSTRGAGVYTVAKMEVKDPEDIIIQNNATINVLLTNTSINLKDALQSTTITLPEGQPVPASIVLNLPNGETRTLTHTQGDYVVDGNRVITILADLSIATPTEQAVRDLEGLATVTVAPGTAEEVSGTLIINISPAAMATIEGADENSNITVEPGSDVMVNIDNFSAGKGDSVLIVLGGNALVVTQNGKYTITAPTGEGNYPLIVQTTDNNKNPVNLTEATVTVIDEGIPLVLNPINLPSTVTADAQGNYTLDLAAIRENAVQSGDPNTVTVFINNQPQTGNTIILPVGQHDIRIEVKENGNTPETSETNSVSQSLTVEAGDSPTTITSIEVSADNIFGKSYDVTLEDAGGIDAVIAEYSNPNSPTTTQNFNGETIVNITTTTLAPGTSVNLYAIGTGDTERKFVGTLSN